MNKHGFAIPLIWVVVIVLFTIIFVGIFGQGSLLPFSRMEMQHQSFTFDGISGTADSPFFGSINNNAIAQYQGIADGFCGNDGDVSVSNSLSDGSSLTLNSGLQSARPCNLFNGIDANFNVPAGVLSGTCSPQDGNSYCQIDGKRYDAGAFQVIYTDPSSVKASVYSTDDQAFNTLKTSVTMTLDFVPKTAEQIQQIQVQAKQQEGVVQQSVQNKNILEKFIDWIRGLLGI